MELEGEKEDQEGRKREEREEGEGALKALKDEKRGICCVGTTVVKFLKR